VTAPAGGALGGPIALDAMGGDRAPAEIVAGAVAAVEELGVEILLVGRPADLAAHLPEPAPPGVTILAAADVIGMEEEPAAAVRGRPDASVVRCADAVKAGDAVAMVSAGNTGAAMTAALLRLGRIKGVARPAIAVPLPAPGRPPQILVDAGASVDCQPEWLAQFGRLGREYARVRCGIEEPRVALLSNGEEPGKGDALRKAAYPLLTEVKGFVGNCEGRDLLGGDVDVFVTDGFTGNVALKTLEGALRTLAGVVFGALQSTEEARAAADAVMPPLLAAASDFDPDGVGGAALLGIRGVCVISHGASSARAVVNAVRVAADSVRAGVVERLAAAAAEGAGRAG
jgi:glycerol-3-phosphate acyltransferase PlsX